MRIIYKIISIPFFLLAFLKWVTYQYPDYNIFKFGGGGILDLGIYGSIGLMINWGIIVILISVGVWIWSKGKSEN